MTTGGQEHGRANQRRRTRTLLLSAASAMLEEDESPSVAEVADRAGVSRATAYRYFPSQASLLVTAALQSATDRTLPPDLEAIGALAAPEERIDALVAAVHRLVAGNEPAFRRMLHASLDPAAAHEPGVPARQGNRLRWIDRALDLPEGTLGDGARRRLVAALALLTGIETAIVMTDVCGLPPAEAEATARWAARALVREALGGDRAPE